MTTTRSPGKKATATRGRILDAAARVFREKGYTGARLVDIAAAANTQAGSLYYHFASREELVDEVLRVGQERTDAFVKQAVEALGETTPLDRVRAAVAAHLAAVLEVGDYTAATLRIIGQVPEDIRRRRLGAQRTYGRWWQSLLEDALAAGQLRSDIDLAIARLLILGALNSTPDWYHPRPKGLTITQLTDQFCVVFLDGLATRRGLKRLSEHVQAIEVPVVQPPSDLTRGAATGQRILDAAAKVFRTHGYAGSRLTDVATEAGIQTGSLYYHFDSREDLVTQLLKGAWEHTDRSVRQGLSALPENAAAIDRVAGAIRAHLQSVLTSSDYTSALVRILGQVPPAVHASSLTFQRDYTAFWHGLLDDAVEAGELRKGLDVSVLVLMLLGALNWTVEWWDPERSPSPAELADQTSLIVFDGLTTAA